MIHVIATIEVAEGRREAFLQHFRQLIPQVLEEEGCIEYGPTIDLETNIGAQIESRENVVTIVEKWESLDHLQQHLAAPHMSAYREKVKNIVVGASLQVLRPV